MVSRSFRDLPDDPPPGWRAVKRVLLWGALACVLAGVWLGVLLLKA